MYSKKKYFIMATVLVLLLAVAGVFIMKKNYDGIISQRENEINNLKQRLDDIGELVTVYQLNTSAKSGTQMQDFQFSTIEIPEYSVPENAIASLEDIEGFYYKISLSSGTIITSDMLMQQKLTDDERTLDVVLDEIPIGIEVGDYVDIRIAFPLGQDYIAMTHKEVVEINGSTLKLIVSQQDFYSYQSMQTDEALYSSTKAYGSTYIEGGMQVAAQQYYPVSLDVLKTMLLDPNIDTSDYSDVLKRREQLEKQLLNSNKVTINDTVTNGKQTLADKFKEAKTDYDALQAQKQAEAAYNDQIQTTPEASSDGNK
jgi:tetrahydromethanopterin S-methyltransferase subunit G